MSANTVILYQSRSGTVEKVAKLLAEKLDNDVDIINLKKDKNPAIAAYSNIVIGGSIRASAIQTGIKKFIEKNRTQLLGKKIGLFLCCMEEGETAEKQFNESYPEELRAMASATGLLGGEFDFDKLNFLEKGIIKKVSGVTKSISNIKHRAIEKFVEDFRA